MYMLHPDGEDCFHYFIFGRANFGCFRKLYFLPGFVLIWMRDAWIWAAPTACSVTCYISCNYTPTSEKHLFSSHFCKVYGKKDSNSSCVNCVLGITKVRERECEKEKGRVLRTQSKVHHVFFIWGRGVTNMGEGCLTCLWRGKWAE